LAVHEPDKDNGSKFDYEEHIHSLLESLSRKNNVQNVILRAFGSLHAYFGNVRSCRPCAAVWTVVQEPDKNDEEVFDYDAHTCSLYWKV
jgi:hypothetical protein